MKKLIILFNLIFIPYSSFAQNLSEVELRKIYLEGFKAYMAGDYSKSLYLFNQVADKNIKLPKKFDVYYAESLIKVGYFSLAQRTIDRYLESTELTKDEQNDLYDLHTLAQKEKRKPYFTKIIFGPESYYAGNVIDGVFHGHGNFFYENGDVYEGNWLNGEKNGKGLYTWADGSFYEGQLRNNRMNGDGHLYWDENRTQYTGKFIDGKITGHGEFRNIDGDYIFEGTFKDSVRVGTGSFNDYYKKKTWTGVWNDDVLVELQRFIRPDSKKYSDGSSYEGMMSNDYRHGLGKLTYSSGLTFETEWNQDKPANGECKVTTSSNLLSYLGQCSGDFIDGKGQFTDKTTGRKVIGNFNKIHIKQISDAPYNVSGMIKLITKEFTYEGSYFFGRMKNGTQTFIDGSVYAGNFNLEEKFHGKGYRQWEGKTFQGEFNNGKMSSGTLTLSNGERYNGLFNSYEQYHGKGEYHYRDGSRFVGDFINGIRTHGTLRFKDGTNYTGEFKNGRLTGKGIVVFTSGLRYVGDLVDSRLEGKGTMYYQSLKRYEGEYLNNDPHGYGWSYDQYGKVEWKGQWIKGKKDKQCRLRCKSPL